MKNKFEIGIFPKNGEKEDDLSKDESEISVEGQLTEKDKNNEKYIDVTAEIIDEIISDSGNYYIPVLRSNKRTVIRPISRDGNKIEAYVLKEGSWEYSKKPEQFDISDLVISEEKPKKYPTGLIFEGEESPKLGGDIKYNQKESILPGGPGDVIYNPETPRFAGESTMGEMIDLYLKQGWNLKVVTDREENAIVTGREGDKIIIKLEVKDDKKPGGDKELKYGKEVRVNIDSIITLEEYNKNKIRIEKQKEISQKRQEEIEANKGLIIGQAIDFYKMTPNPMPWEKFSYQISVEGYGIIRPISQDGVKVRASYQSGKDSTGAIKYKEKVFSMKEIEIEKDDIIYM